MEAGTNLLLFFTLPFAALVATVARAEFPDWAPRALAVTALLLASLFAAVGLWQAATHELFFYAPNLAVSNANTRLLPRHLAVRRPEPLRPPRGARHRRGRWPARHPALARLAR